MAIWSVVLFTSVVYWPSANYPPVSQLQYYNLYMYEIHAYIHARNEQTILITLTVGLITISVIVTGPCLVFRNLLYNILILWLSLLHSSNICWLSTFPHWHLLLSKIPIRFTEMLRWPTVMCTNSTEGYYFSPSYVYHICTKVLSMAFLTQYQFLPLVAAIFFHASFDVIQTNLFLEFIIIVSFFLLIHQPCHNLYSCVAGYPYYFYIQTPLFTLY